MFHRINILFSDVVTHIALPVRKITT